MKRTMRKALRSLIIVAGVAAALWLGAAVIGCGKSSTGGTPARKEQATQIYTCPMHPEIRQDKPGKCPKCGMDLVPAAQGATTK